MKDNFIMATPISVAFLTITGTIVQAFAQVQGGQQAGVDNVDNITDCGDLMSSKLVTDIVRELATRINIMCAIDRIVSFVFE
jgi:hypothetical protein